MKTISVIQYMTVMEGEHLIIVVCHYRICDWSLISEQMNKTFEFSEFRFSSLKGNLLLESFIRVWKWFRVSVTH